MKNKLPNCFIAGCQKTGSTWLYHCFDEHPEIFVPSIDRLNYFSIHHYKGLDSLQESFKEVVNEKAICDPTPSYFQSPGIAKRISEYNSKSKIIITLRNPVERSYSHYKHLYRKGHISVGFDQALFKAGVGSFDFYRLLIHPSLYFENLSKFYDQFPSEQILVNLYDDLEYDPKKYLKNIFEFLEVDPHFTPTIIDKKKNTDSQRSGKIDWSRDNFVQKIQEGNLITSAKRVFINKLFHQEKHRKVSSKVTLEMRTELNKLFKEDIERVSRLINRDLSHWT